MPDSTVVSSPLCSLFRLPETRADAPVCYLSDRTVFWPEFRRDVARCVAVLSERTEQRWCLVAESSYAFSVGFMAALFAEKTVILPPNVKLGTLQHLKPQFAAVLSDTETAEICLPAVSILDCNVNSEHSLNSLDSESPSIELYTSGSSGAHKRVTKCFSNFQAEVAVLERSWGKVVADCVIVSTVPHHHIYGLLYKIVWPLTAGRPFEDKIAFYPNEIASHIERHNRVAIISSPAHLKRFCEIGQLLSQSCATVFSSGGLLTSDTSAEACRYLGSTPIEVLGSTETGGVAWRQQKNSRDAWKPLEEVELRIEADRGLQVCSSFIGPKSARCWAEMGDGAEQLAGGEFKLLPRRDRISKVEDRRFAPADMERRLSDHPGVEDAAVIVLTTEGSSGSRSIVAAAVVLSLNGVQLLRNSGRKKFAEQLRNFLKEYFDAVLLPKRWRFNYSLPSDERGKRPLAELEQLFDERLNDEPTMPELISVKRDQSEVSLSLRVPSNLAYFPGHFPGQPVVPGFVQVDWVMHYAKEYFATGAPVCSIEALKFQNVLLPDNEFELEMQWSAARQRLQFNLRGETQTHASGRILFDSKNVGN